MPGSLLIVIITLHFLLVMLGFNIITVCSFFSVPYRSPSLLSPQSSSAQHSFVLTETQKEPAKFTQRFIAYITLAHVYANSHLHIQNVCLLLPVNMFYFCNAMAVHANSLLLPHNQYVLFPKTIHFRHSITLLSQKPINAPMFPYTNVFALFFLPVLPIMSLSLFSFLNVHHPLSSFAQTLLLLTLCRRKSSSSTSSASLLLFLTCLTQRHLLLPLLEK